MSTAEHTHEADFGTGKKSFATYSFGVVLCIILTIIPFSVVMIGTFSHAFVYTILIISALAQFLVQVLCFLRLNIATEQAKMNVMAFIFSIVVLATIVGCSVWIMWQLNYHMMH